MASKTSSKKSQDPESYVSGSLPLMHNIHHYAYDNSSLIHVQKAHYQKFSSKKSEWLERIIPPGTLLPLEDTILKMIFINYTATTYWSVVIESSRISYVWDKSNYKGICLFQHTTIPKIIFESLNNIIPHNSPSFFEKITAKTIKTRALIFFSTP